MCDNCGCSITPGTPGNKQLHDKDGDRSVQVLQHLLAENDRLAEHNRTHFNRHQVLALNLMSSPGSGKTALLEATIDALKTRFNIAVIEGDLETQNDAERIRAKGVSAIQICTGTACHLDAHMVHDALHQLDLSELDIVFIENVGNLVCPAGFDLGQHHNITLLSVTEGDDKPAKYPVMFRASDLMLITKTDLLAYLDDFDTAAARACLRQLANDAPVIEVSVKQPGSLDLWLQWISDAVERNRQDISITAHERSPEYLTAPQR